VVQLSLSSPPTRSASTTTLSVHLRRSPPSPRFSRHNSHIGRRAVLEFYLFGLRVFAWPRVFLTAAIIIPRTGGIKHGSSRLQGRCANRSFREVGDNQGTMIFSKLAVLLVGAVASVHGDAIANEKVAKRGIRPNPSNGHWIDAWATMPQLTEPANLPPTPFVRCLHHYIGSR
jgi:hypothetical protein